MNQIFLETRMFWLSDGEEIMNLAFFVLIQYRSVTTDRQTDIPPLAIPAVCIARYANALVKINESNRIPIFHVESLLKTVKSFPKMLKLRFKSQSRFGLALHCKTSLRKPVDIE